MRIGIDSTCWTNWRGFGRYTRSLVRAILDVDTENEYLLFFDAAYPRCRGVPEQARHVVVETEQSQDAALSLSTRRSLRDVMRMRAAVSLESLDLFFFPSIDSFFPLPAAPRKLLAIHDTIPERLAGRMLPRPLSRLRRRIKVAWALHQADRVVTGSERARAEIRHVFGLSEDRIEIVPYGADALFCPAPRSAARERIAQRFGIDSPFLLHVGGIGPNKNVPMLIDAFSSLATGADSSAAPLLLFVGHHDDDEVYPDAAEARRRISRHGLERRIRHLGFQPDAVLVDLYRSAEALVLPSLVEGFGLPGLEAAACGTPSVVTRESPLPEVLGEAAWVIDPRRCDELERALRAALCAADAAVRREAARRLAPRLGWQEAARCAVRLFAREGTLGDSHR